VTEVPELRTERLVMRGWRAQDFKGWAAIFADDEVMRSLGAPGGLDEPEAWKHMAMWVGHWELRGFGHWLLEELESGELVGRAGLYYPAGWPGIEVGWTVARAHWGKGYAPEAARAACAWGHDELGLQHIISLIEPSNTRSIRVAEKLGETVEGRFQLREFDLLVYGADLPLGGSPAKPSGTDSA
jgi:RimJ/RimL family protein N-acetyltransferase